MFRLVFLAFHGERRLATAHAPAHPEEEEPPAHGAHGHGAHDAHGHGGHLHDAPPSMAIPLIVLAIGSVFAGYIGVPHALGGSNRIEQFLEPSFGVEQRVGEHAVNAETEGHGAASAEGEHAVGADAGTELTLMAVSSGIALIGIGIATFFFLKRRDRAEALARAAAGPHKLLLNKYYVDELYDAVIVQPIKRISTVALWRGVDAGVIDGTVNGTGTVVRAGSAVLRRVQTGSMRTYAASLFLGVVAILGYYLWW
jgi:NADH-quinone oxidoreductase subunit L